MLIGIYGGYFGAAAGVLLLALLLRTTHSSLARANATKNVLLGVANTCAAVLFVFLAPVDWAAAVPLGDRLPDRVQARPDRRPARPGGRSCGW